MVVDLDSTKVIDADLEHLKGFTKLKELLLADTRITDAGLVHLKELTKLQTLDLCFNVPFVKSEVTDAGLVHLKGLSNLQDLDLGGTKVTDAGVKKLQQALPKCKIERY